MGMPTAGWGYGAIANNFTDDFLALLYGHMATYLSRGTFHSTEQLSFRGEGWYRDFLHWPNPPPNGTADAAHLRLQYYGNENDVSFCIVSEIIVARMTRWQLVFEDLYRPKFGSENWSCHHWTSEEEARVKSAPDAQVCTDGGHRWTGGHNEATPGCRACSCCAAQDHGSIWLARGAPKRWFGVGGGFKVTAAPTRFGALSYEVTVDKDEATYQVTVPNAAPADLRWKLRWPLGATQVRSQGCTVVDTSPNGIVTVIASSGVSFTVWATSSESSLEIVV